MFEKIEKWIFNEYFSGAGFLLYTLYIGVTPRFLTEDLMGKVEEQNCRVGVYERRVSVSEGNQWVRFQSILL